MQCTIGRRSSRCGFLELLLYVCIYSLRQQAGLTVQTECSVHPTLPSKSTTVGVPYHGLLCIRPVDPTRRPAQALVPLPLAGRSARLCVTLRRPSFVTRLAPAAASVYVSFLHDDPSSRPLRHLRPALVVAAVRAVSDSSSLLRVVLSVG